MIFKEKLLAAI